MYANEKSAFCSKLFFSSTLQTSTLTPQFPEAERKVDFPVTQHWLEAGGVGGGARGREESVNKVWITIHPLFTFPLWGYNFIACYQHHRNNNRKTVSDSSSELLFSAPSHIPTKHPNMISNGTVPKPLIVSRTLCSSLEPWKAKKSSPKMLLSWCPLWWISGLCELLWCFKMPLTVSSTFSISSDILTPDVITQISQLISFLNLYT